MNFPFPMDKLAMARQDFCMAPENLSYNETQLTCSLNARQCGSYIASTRDPDIANTAGEPLLRSLQQPSISGWLGTDYLQLIDGTMGCAALGASEQYRQSLWNKIGYRTVENSAKGAQEAIAGQAVSAPLPDTQHQLLDPAFGSPAFMVAKYLQTTQPVRQPAFAFSPLTAS